MDVRAAAHTIGNEHAGEMFYPDGRGAATLADTVFDAPMNASQQFDVELRDATSGCIERVVDDPRPDGSHPAGAGDRRTQRFDARTRLGHSEAATERIVDSTEKQGEPIDDRSCRIDTLRGN